MNESNVDVAEASSEIRQDAADSNNPTIKQIVESIVGETVWMNDSEAYCECPGKANHTTRNNLKDCKLYLDSVPTLSCFHGSCKSTLESANRRLRQALRDNKVSDEPRRLTAEEKQRKRELARKEKVRKRATHSKTTILRTHRWRYQEILADSPNRLPVEATDHWKLLLSCFESTDVVWIGNTYDSGTPVHQNHFRMVEDWLKEPMVPGSYVCGSSFQAGSYQRTNDNVAGRKFLVVESDVLDRDQVGAIFYWLCEKVELKLRAIVDTAGKSLHAWFEYPPDEVVEELKLILPGLDCDPKLFTASQPVRLPGALRGSKYQRLIYLNQEAQR